MTGSRPRSMMSRAVDPMSVPATLPRPWVDRQIRHESELRGSAVDCVRDVGVHLDVDARVVGFGAERLRCFGADAIQLEVGDRDGDGVDCGVEPCRERPGRGERTICKSRAVERDEDRVVDGVRCSMS